MEVSDPMTARCTDCGRVRVDGVWTWVELVPERAFPGLCAPCGERRRKAAVLRWNAACRRTVRRQQGREPWAEGTTPADVWKGFREGDR